MSAEDISNSAFISWLTRAFAVLIISLIGGWMGLLQNKLDIISSIQATRGERISVLEIQAQSNKWQVEKLQERIDYLDKRIYK